MAVVCAVISGPLALLFSVLWLILTGGTVVGFFLAYLLSGQVIFISLLALCHLAHHLRDLRERVARQAKFSVDNTL